MKMEAFWICEAAKTDTLDRKIIKQVLKFSKSRRVQKIIKENPTRAGKIYKFQNVETKVYKIFNWQWKNIQVS